MSQQTLGIISIQVKNQFLKEIYKYQVVTERQFDLSVQDALQVLKLDIKEQQLVYGFILEGPNAIEDWYSVVTRSAARSKRFIIHGSSNPDNARRETDWFQSLLLNNSSSSSPVSKKKAPTTISGTQQRKPGLVRSTVPPTTTMTTKATTKTSRTITTTKLATRSKIPSSNTAKSNMTTTRTNNPKSVTPKRPSEATTTNRRGSLVASSLPTKKLLSTTTKGGVSKNTPPVSIITGRTRKPSRLTEKRPVTTAATTTTKNKVQPIAIKEVAVNEPIVKKEVDEAIAIKEEEAVAAQDESTIAIKEEPIAEEDATVSEEEPEKETVVITKEPEKEAEVTEELPAEDQEFINESPPPVSHLSTCSSAATDEHDAEVAAAMQKRPIVDSFAFTNSGRSSFSPNSVASLPRPETPEVDQLRLKFETIIQTTTPAESQMLRRPSKISPEFVSRIKEMKPRGPAGARVKSMVELFMDENLNKWEF